MHKLHEVKYMLMEEMETHAEDGKLTAQSLEEIDKLAHALKNVCKVIETCEDDEYRESGYYSRDGGMSTRRGRDRMGRYTSRDEGPDASMEGRSMARSMSTGNKEQVINMLENYLHTDADERTRGRVRELIRDMRNG